MKTFLIRTIVFNPAAEHIQMSSDKAFRSLNDWNGSKEIGSNFSPFK